MYITRDTLHSIYQVYYSTYIEIINFPYTQWGKYISSKLWINFIPQKEWNFNFYNIYLLTFVTQIGKY